MSRTAVKRILPVLLALPLLAGCTRQYVMTLNNGSRVSCVGKPKLEDGSYVTKDSRGQRLSIPAGRVRDICPASMASEKKPQYIQ